MMRFCALLLVFCCSLPLCGCSGYYIREGVWELSFQTVIDNTGDPLYVEKHLVTVLIEASPDGTAQVAEITKRETESDGEESGAMPPDGDRRATLPRLYADIKVRRRGDAPTAFITSQDSDWLQINMRGRVDSDRHIVGTHFTARQREEPTVLLKGRWDMRWIRD